MKLTMLLVSATLSVGMIGAAFAADAPTPAPATDAATPAPTPPATLKCKAPKVPTQVKNKAGKLVWKCVKPAA